jgi:molybdopterin-containing oxidoreductase family iron-sulfur binding subunit
MSEPSPKYWRSLEELADAAGATEAAHREFTPEALDDSLSAATVSRRGFLGLVGATAALATAACTVHDRTIVPYTKRPKEVIPGVANYYASTFSEAERSYSVLVKTREGRPIHVTGNDEHPRFKGKTSLRAMADLSTLYDPDRVRTPQFEQRPSSWSEADKALGAALAAAKRDNQAVLLITGATDSPSRKALLAELKASLPTLEHLSYEPGISDSIQASATAAFGRPVQVRPRLQEMSVILALGADFLAGDDPEAVAAFTRHRRPNGPASDMNRLWVFEGPLSLTGANADQRFPVRPSRIAGLGFALVHELHARHGIALPPGVSVPAMPKELPAESGIPNDAWDKLVADLATARSKAVVLAGDSMSADAQIAAHLLNTMLGSVGVEHRPSEASATLQDIQTVVNRLEAGQYAVAILWGVNLAYVYPNAQQWASAFGKVPLRASIGLFDDESASLCQWLLPANHWLESWGDFGTPELLTLQQPAVAPLYDTRQGEDVLLALLRALGTATPPDYHAYLRQRWQREVQPSDSLVPFDRFFDAVLHDGVLQRDRLPVATPVSIQPAAVSDAARRAIEKPTEAGFELVLQPGTQVYDGRYANNGWLQELPDPITKSTWGNPLLVSVPDAQELGIKNGELVHLELDDVRLSLPVIAQPGQAKGVLALALGYGRTKGTVARGVGVNAFPLVAVDAAAPHARRAVKLTQAVGSVRLPMTQSHHRMEGRDLVRSLTLTEFASVAQNPKKKVELTTLYPDQQFPKHKWGMTIDLSACVGCAACVIACQSENNIATVGPEQIERGREMHWIRIDSYYEGKADNPQVVHQPMLCQHCDSAPCENVCPVNATNHSPEGLNQMAYNRCVGTRYCANNCPYKVRRYNFFDYTSEKTEPEDLVYNPEVTVRPRGVMEKCTFCVQRIEDGKMRAKVESRVLGDGDIVPACAAACPSEAIVFGDLKNPGSRVSELKRSPRGYQVLEEVGTRPAITYLANLKNPALVGGTHE